jgi:hypothetical protein
MVACTHDRILHKPRRRVTEGDVFVFIFYIWGEGTRSESEGRERQEEVWAAVQGVGVARQIYKIASADQRDVYFLFFLLFGAKSLVNQRKTKTMKMGCARSRIKSAAHKELPPPHKSIEKMMMNESKKKTNKFGGNNQAKGDVLCSGFEKLPASFSSDAYTHLVRFCLLTATFSLGLCLLSFYPNKPSSLAVSTFPHSVRSVLSKLPPPLLFCFFLVLSRRAPPPLCNHRLGRHAEKDQCTTQPHAPNRTRSPSGAVCVFSFRSLRPLHRAFFIK